MSAKPTNLSELTRCLIDKGYTARQEKSCLIVSDVPYLDVNLNVQEDGIMYDSYPKSDHTMHFSAVPYALDGREFFIAGKPDQWNGYPAKARLSCKKSDGKNQLDYSDEYDKWIYYLELMDAHAQGVDPSATAKRHRPIDTSNDPSSSFMYEDSNSARAGINHVSGKFQGHKIAIVGLGGTGAYILDLVSKTPVGEIHLFDDDRFHTHNAFRSPGAATQKNLDNPTSKVKYHKRVYSRMHKGIIAHEQKLTAVFVQEHFTDYSFVFISIDASEEKKHILNKLIELRIPFVDCGLSVEEHDSSLNGTIRLTTFTAEKNDHLGDRVHCDYSENDLYGSNIQIAELNALNATLAVIKWKRIVGFYHDHETEHHTLYMLNCNSLSNDEKI